MGGSRTTQQTHTKREPWEPARGNLQNVLSGAQNIAADPSKFQSQYSDTYNNALDRFEAISQTPSAANQYLRPVVEGAAQNYATGQEHLRGIASGDPASNPFLEAIIKRQQESTSNAVNGQFSAAGRYGSGAHTGSLTKQLGNQELGLRYDDYNAQQGRQDQAANVLFNQGMTGSQMGGQLDANEMQRAGLQQQVGEQRNAILNDANLADVRANEWLAAQTVPIAGLGGTTDSTSISRTSSNPLGMVLGGLQMGASAMSGMPMMGGGMMGGMSGGGSMMAPPPPMMAPRTYQPMMGRQSTWGYM